jgi:hypothetical protein
MGLYTNSSKMGMPYINGIKHNAYIGGQKIWNVSSAPVIPAGAFSITVNGGGLFNLQTRGVNGTTSTYQSYNWIIDWGDGTTQTVSGTGTSSSGIPHTYASSGNHIIIIKPNGTATQGWLNAFGCSSTDATNPVKITAINAPITELMKTMTTYGYRHVFQGCTGLTTIPENLLPATTLASYCYQNMFHSCTGLTTIPANLLHSATLADNCYRDMFTACTGLTFIPNNLLSTTTTLPTNCYQNMFNNCSGLTDIGNIDSAWFAARTPQKNMFFQCVNIVTPITYAQIPTAWKAQ